MTLGYPDRYVWDHWMFDDGELFHIFHLQAPRKTSNANERHFLASVGHATSRDLINWSEVGTALEKSPAGAWDDVATWTGSVIQDPKSKKYFMFYTGVHKSGNGYVQSIGVAISNDLNTWQKYGSAPILVADPDLYQCQENGDENTDFRDPWVFFDERDNFWHMLITASSKSDPNIMTRGVVGHATSEDLLHWKVLPSPSGSSSFGQTEVLQVLKVEGKYVGIFCCGGGLIADKPERFVAGTYSVPMDSPTGPFHFDKADIFNAPFLYAGRIIKDRNGQLNLLGFTNAISDSDAPCIIQDPIPVHLTPQGTLQVG
jgi:beta-fructofuranosidase